MDILNIIKRIKKYWSNMKNLDKWLILLLIISFLIRILFLTYSPIRGWDETVYLNLGHDLSINPFSYSLATSGWNDFIPANDFIYSWPNIGFRAPLLPYTLSFFYFLHLDFLIPFVIPFFATASVFLVYILGKNMFNKNIGLYGATFFSLIPINIFCSERIWTDSFVVFFILLTFISFWKGYEGNNKRYKILFGLFLALSLLARYTTLWITPVFLLSLLIRDKSLKFLQDKYLWKAIGLFFLVLIPWFIYGYFFYNNPLGGFIHGFKASAYWGGVQSWNYFFTNSWLIFSILGELFLVSLLYILYKKEYIHKEIYLLMIWGISFSIIVMAMPHKEERFITPVIPVICLLGAFFIDKLKKYKYIIFGIICLILLISFYRYYNLRYKESLVSINVCFEEGNTFLSSDTIEPNSLIVSNQDPIVHYYTQRDTIIYPEPWSLAIFRNLINSKYKDKIVYIYFANYDMDMSSKIKKDLDNNFKKVFECSKEWGYSTIYKY